MSEVLRTAPKVAELKPREYFKKIEVPLDQQFSNCRAAVPAGGPVEKEIAGSQTQSL